ncbi:MAG: isochorismatase family protein [Dehalococcoidia bacterium]|nr:isochorismatase family protein [Dehalococcoidia bacterium]
MAIWDDVIPESDRKMFAKAGMGGGLQWGERPAVIVVDMSYAFADSRYPTGSSEMGEPTTRAIRRLLDAARPNGVPIFFTTASISKLPAQAGHWKANWEVAPGLPDPMEIVPEIAPREGEVLIAKLRPSAFFGTSLVDMLIYHQVDTVIVTGMTTSGCVRATVVDAFSYNYRVIVPEECSGDRAVLSHKVSLLDMHMKYADVAPLRRVEEYLGRLPLEARAQAPAAR